jgi:hypothetical protein
MSTQNSLTKLAEHHHALTNHGPFDTTAACCTPLADKSTIGMLESHAECLCCDVTDGLQALGALVANYPRDCGEEELIMPRVGALIRLMGEVLEYARDAKDAAADRLYQYREIENATAATTKPKRQASAPAE